MKNTKGCIRLLAAMLSLIMVMSIGCVAIFADNDQTTGTSESQTTNTPSEGTTEPSQTTPGGTEPSQTTPESSESTAVTEPVAPPEIISASLEYGNYKKDYFTGETFDPSNIYVILSYIGLPSERIELSKFGNYSPTTLTATDKAVTVKVNDIFSFDIPVNVSNVEVLSVTPSFGAGVKTKYLQGEKFDPTGITLTVKYNNGVTETVTDTSKFTIYPSGALTDENLVSISYGGKNIPLRISVTPVSTITIISNETHPVFGQYQLFDRSKILVIASYAGGETRVVDDYIVEDGGLETTGEGTINIRYYGASASLNVSVVELMGIRVNKRPTKTSYNEGEFLVSEGLEVCGIYEINGNTVEYPIGGYTLDAQKLIPDEEGLYEVSVNFRDVFTDSFSVNVSPIVQLFITKLPSKLSYYEGEALDLTGITVQAIFANGQKIDDFKEYSVPAESLYIDSAVMPVIQYREVKAVITVTVIAIRGIGVTKNPNRILYTEDEIFDPTGIEIIAYYEDDTYKAVEPGACTFPTEPLKIYDTSVTVKFKEFSYSVEIIVTDKIYAKSLDAVVLPNTSFVSGQLLSLDGLKLVLTLSNGQTEVIDVANVTMVPAIGTQLFSGIDTEVIITYLYNEEQEISCTIPINVSDKTILSLFISKNPDKMIYTESEMFDPKGMVVRAYYNDNTTEEITNYSVTSTPFILSESTTQKVLVYVSAGAANLSFEVTVNPAIISAITVTTPPAKVSYDPGERFDPTGMLVKVTYANGKSFVLSEDLYTIVNTEPFKAGDSMVTIEFRGKTTALSVSVSGEVTSGNVTTDTTTETEPTTTPDVTTPNTSERETTSPKVTTTVPTGDETTQGGNDSSSGLRVIFIAILVFVVALIVFLIIYYRRNFC